MQVRDELKEIKKEAYQVVRIFSLKCGFVGWLIFYGAARLMKQHWRHITLFHNFDIPATRRLNEAARSSTILSTIADNSSLSTEK